MTIHILGAGVAGLSCALAFLQRSQGQDVVIYERDTAETLPLRAGHGLILMQNGVDALKVLGCEHVLDDCAPITQAVLQSEQGLTLRSLRAPVRCGWHRVLLLRPPGGRVSIVATFGPSTSFREPSLERSGRLQCPFQTAGPRRFRLR